LLHNIRAGCRRRQGPAVNAVQLDYFFHDVAQFPEDFLFVVAMAATSHKSGGAPNVALIDLRPFDDFDIACALSHCFESSIAFRTFFT
jgi:hypothetical protein